MTILLAARRAFNLATSSSARPRAYFSLLAASPGEATRTISSPRQGSSRRGSRPSSCSVDRVEQWARKEK